MMPDWDTCLSIMCSDASKSERAKHAEEVERVLNALTDALEEIADLEEIAVVVGPVIARTAIKNVKRDFAA